MPLLNKRPLERFEIPSDMQASDKVYYLEASNEVFLTYDEFFERMIQLNSTLWSCEFTGRTGLTFFEALESEKNALKALGNFPAYLERPILFLVKKYVCRGRFEDLLNDIFSFMKDRYFIGEQCFYIEDNKKRNVRVTGCTIIEDWEPIMESKKELQMPPPELYRYSVLIIGGDEEDDIGTIQKETSDGKRVGVEHMSLARNKNIASKPKLKLFLKNSCTIRGDHYEVKDKFLRDGIVNSLDWKLVLGGPLPFFPQTPMLQRGRQPKAPAGQTQTGGASIHSNGIELNESKTLKRRSEKMDTPRSGMRASVTEKKKQQILAQQDELSPTFETARRLGIDLTNYEQVERVLSGSEISELKDRIKVTRVQERESAREAKKMKQKAKYEWQKKRDDLDCDDLKSFPVLPALPLPHWMEDEDFSEYLAILQFFVAFQDLLPLKEVRGTSRIFLSDIIIAIRCGDPQSSPYADLMKVLLSARTDRADEEDGDEADLSNKEEIALIQLQNCDPDHKIHGENIREMNYLHEDIRLIHGQSVRYLPVDWMTLTETLRLVIITSGYYTGQSTHRHRLFARGNYKGYEDAGYVFRLQHPETMNKLRTGTVFDLEPSERLSLMKLIISQLLSYNKFRTHQDDRLNELWEQRRELKKLRNWDMLQEQEAKDARLAREYEMEMIEEKGEVAAKEQISAWPIPSKETIKLKMHLKAVRDGRRTDREELEQMLLSGVAYNELDLDEIITAREIQREKVKDVEDTLMKTILDLATVAGQLHLGRDRAYRNFFMLECVPAIIVENPIDRDHIGTCVEPTPVADYTEYGSPEAARHFILGCSGNMATCSVHGEAQKQRPRWTYVNSMEKIDQILAACNPRGYREIDLAEEISFYRPRIAEIMDKVERKTEAGQYMPLFLTDQQDPALQQNSIDWEGEMRELLLDLEEKMEQGLLGRLPSSIDRLEWRRILLESGDITSLMERDVVVKGSDDKIIWTKEELLKLTSVQKLAVAFLQLAQGISLKFYRMPFAVPSKDDASVVMATPVFLRWQRALLACDSIPAISLFLSTLEPAIHWDKSRLQGRCRGCRRKGSAESLVLCDDCDKCFHLECARLSPPAPIDWCCSDCLANRRKRAAAERRRAAREAVQEQYEDLIDDIADENSVETGTDDESSRSNMGVTRTSSGRAVKRVIYNENSLAESPPPPLKTSKRNSTRSNGNSQIYDYEEDYDSEASSVTRSKRKRKADDVCYTPVRSMSTGLRDTTDTSTKQKIERLEKLIREAMRQSFAWPFLDPVDKRDVPDYYDIITRPMDLRTMINKIKQRVYDTAEEIRSDIYLIVANCKEYNMEGSEIYECADKLEDFFENRLKTVFDDKKRKR